MSTMRGVKTWVCAAALAAVMVGCSNIEPDHPDVQAAPVPPPEPIIIRVSGYGAYADPRDRLLQRHRLMAMRASKLDAYRALVERVYGTTLSGSSTVQDMVLQDDRYRTMVDSVIRGARVVSVNELPGGGYETVMELELSGNFQQCLTNVNFFRYSDDCRIPLTPRNNALGGDVVTPLSASPYNSAYSATSAAASSGENLPNTVMSTSVAPSPVMPSGKAKTSDGKAKSNYLYNISKGK